MGVWGRLFVYAIFLISVLFMVMGVKYGWETASFLSGAEKVSGTVIYNYGEYDDEGMMMYKQQIKYTSLDGREKTVVTRSSQNSEVSVGTRLGVYVKGEEARVGGLLLQCALPVGLFVLGGVLLTLWVWTTVRYQNARWAREHGEKIEAVIAEVEPAGSANDVPGWRLVCEWEDPVSSKKCRLVSGIFYRATVPEKFVRGGKVAAWVDPGRPEKRHYVEVE